MPDFLNQSAANPATTTAAPTAATTKLALTKLAEPVSVVVGRTPDASNDAILEAAWTWPFDWAPVPALSVVVTVEPAGAPAPEVAVVGAPFA